MHANLSHQVRGLKGLPERRESRLHQSCPAPGNRAKALQNGTSLGWLLSTLVNRATLTWFSIRRNPFQKNCSLKPNLCS